MSTARSDDSERSESIHRDVRGGPTGVNLGEAISDHVELLAVMGREFADSRNIEKTLRRGLARITEYLHAEGGALFLLDDAGTKLTCTCCAGGTNIEGLVLNSDQGIVGASVRCNKGELVRDVSQDPRFFVGVDRTTGFVTRSIICAPMSVREERIGAIELVNKKGADFRFNAADLRILETMAASAALAIINAQMAEALVEQERVRRELELAAEIQRGLLPDDRGPRFPVHGINRPASTVSGDFYDFFELPDGRICFNVGDVSGKGMNAALLMAKTASLYRCLGKTIHSPGRVLARVNAELCETATHGMFVTMVGGIYDPYAGVVTLANAGHEPPLLTRDGRTVASLPADTPPLGIATDFVTAGMLPETTVRLDGGCLYIFTDGATEGYLSDATIPGAEGVADILNRQTALPTKERLAAMLAMYEREGRALRDDVTVLAIDDGVGAETRRDVGDTAGVSAAVEEQVACVTVPASPDRLRLVRCLVSMIASDCGFDAESVHDIVLAVDEACQNIIRHAYHGNPAGEIQVTISRRNHDFLVYLRDYAEPVDESKIRPRELDDVRPGGLGVHFIRSVMDDARYMPPPTDGGNVLRMLKRRESQTQ